MSARELCHTAGLCSGLPIVAPRPLRSAWSAGHQRHELEGAGVASEPCNLGYVPNLSLSLSSLLLSTIAADVTYPTLCLMLLLIFLCDA